MAITRECTVEELDDRLRTQIQRVLVTDEEVTYCSQTADKLLTVSLLYADVITERRFIHAQCSGSRCFATSIELANIGSVYNGNQDASVTSSFGHLTTHPRFASRVDCDRFCQLLGEARARASEPMPRNSTDHTVDDILRLVQLHKDGMLTEAGLKSELKRILGGR